MESLVVISESRLIEIIRDIIREERANQDKVNTSKEQEAVVRYLTKKEVSEVAKVSVKTIDRLVKNDKLRAHRFGQNVRFKQSDIDEFLRRIEVGK